jgi:hypothetical protein
MANGHRRMKAAGRRFISKSDKEGLYGGKLEGGSVSKCVNDKAAILSLFRPSRIFPSDHRLACPVLH